MASNDKDFGNSKRFTGDALDPLEYRRWRLWVEARMAAQKDMQPQQRGPFVFCLLDGTGVGDCRTPESGSAQRGEW